MGAGRCFGIADAALREMLVGILRSSMTSICKHQVGRMVGFSTLKTAGYEI